MNYFHSKKHIENAKKASVLGLEKIKEITLERIEDYFINPNKCAYCNKDLPYEKKHRKFCNSSCAASANNKKRKLSDETKSLIRNKLKGRKQTDEHKDKVRGNKNGRWKGGLSIKENVFLKQHICVVCGNIFIPQICLNGKPSKSKSCSNECRLKLRSKNGRLIINKRIANGTHRGWNSRNIISYPEKFFIGVLKNNNIKFEHNYPINKKSLGEISQYNYFLDFYVKEKNIDLEIDGEQHKSRKEHDNYRDNLLRKNGYIVYRIKWANINNEKGKEYIKNEIDKFLKFYNNI